MPRLPLGVTASSGTGLSEVDIVNTSDPSPLELTGGLVETRNSGTQNHQKQFYSSYIRLRWPQWCGDDLATNNTFDLTGMTRYEIDFNSSGANSQYANFSIGYTDINGDRVIPENLVSSGSGDGPRRTQSVEFGQNVPPGVGPVYFLGGNTFGDVYVYRLTFYPE